SCVRFAELARRPRGLARIRRSLLGNPNPNFVAPVFPTRHLREVWNLRLTHEVVSDGLGCRSIASRGPMNVKPIVHTLPSLGRCLQLRSEIDAMDLALV